MNQKDTKPERKWSGEYGVQWTEDNYTTPEQINSLYKDRFGQTKQELVERFVGDLDRESKILEVGSNVGTQLLFFKELGFDNLYGIDIQREAIEIAHQERPELDIIEGNLYDIPFRSGFFDLVFTSGVLIHVHPDKIDQAVEELIRCTSDRIYGHEYYAEEYTEITHRGEDGVLWKTDFPSIFLKKENTTLIDQEHLEHKENDNVDIEYTLTVSNHEK